MHRNNIIKNTRKQVISPFIGLEYNNLYRDNQETNNNNKITKIKEFTDRAKRAISRT